MSSPAARSRARIWRSSARRGCARRAATTRPGSAPATGSPRCASASKRRACCWRGAPLAVGPGDVDRFAHYRDSLNNRTLTLHDLATREGLTLATDELLHWSHWITPEAWPKRFDTHFFLAVAPPEQEAAHDRLEVTASVWTTPEDALAGYERGDFPLVFATEHQLRALANIPSVAAARDRFSAGKVRTMRPHVVHEDGREVIVLPDVPDGDEQ